MLPSPCIELDCDSLGGMSGGPVFDSQGKLIAILSSSLSSEDQTKTSYASLIWPALVTKFEGGWPHGLVESPTTLVALDDRLRSIDNVQCLYEETDANGEVATWYDWWE